MTGFDLVPRATVEQMVENRNRAVELFGVAFERIAEADKAIKEAWGAAAPFKPDVHIGYHDSHSEELKKFYNAVSLPDPEQYAKTASRLIDIQFWTWLIEKGDLQRLMDKQARDQLRDQLSYRAPKANHYGEVIDEDEASRSFPPVTVENVLATIDSLAGQADMIFRRGIANAFAKLDRRFRSHDGFKIGSRVILTWVMDANGWFNYGNRQVETLQDIERAFTVIEASTIDDEDAKKALLGRSFQQAESALRAGKSRLGSGPEQFEVETPYFKIRVFKNGNAHLWMRRDDLVAKVNKLLGEYYGEVVADGQTKDDPFAEKKGPLAHRDFDLFPTPELVREHIKHCLHDHGLSETARWLEPSAGTGNLVHLAAHRGHKIDCVEIEAGRVAALRKMPEVRKIWHGDFLRLNPQTTGLYDRIVMNPPFSRERDIDHVQHAWSFLAPGGRLVAVMSAGTEFRETRKAIAFRALVEKHGEMHDLPERAFAEVGTNVNTILVVLRKPAA